MVTAEIYYIIAGVVYTIFLIRIIALWTIGDFDFSFDTDFSLGDIISFKGLLHFLMGFAGYMSLKYYIGDIPDFLDYIIASILGVIFIFILYFIYKLIYNLNSTTKPLTGRELVGRTGIIQAKLGCDDSGLTFYYTVSVNNNVGSVNVDAHSDRLMPTGSNVELLDYKDFGLSYYII